MPFVVLMVLIVIMIIMSQIRWRLQHLSGMNKLIILMIETFKNQKQDHLISVVSEDKRGKGLAFS